MGRPQPSAELKDLTYLFESGVLEQGNMENMQGGGRNTGLGHHWNEMVAPVFVDEVYLQNWTLSLVPFMICRHMFICQV